MLNIQFDPADSISRIISGSILAGGALYFAEEGMTLGAKELFGLLVQVSEVEARISKVSLLNMNTENNLCPQDILFLGDVSETQVCALARVCTGKIIKCAPADWPKSLFDVHWDDRNRPVREIFAVIEQSCRAIENMKQTTKEPKIFDKPSLKEKAVALFLDRDDVIVSNVPYNNDPAKVILIPGIEQLIKRAHQKNELVIICSNQSGIGRGWVSIEQYHLVHQRMLQLLKSEGASIDDCFWASYIESSVMANQDLEPQMRKPRPGMFLLAANKWNIDLTKSRMIGDSATDLMAAHHAGVKNLFLLASEKTEKEIASLSQFQKRFSDFNFSTLPDLTSI